MSKHIGRLGDLLVVEHLKQAEREALIDEIVAIRCPTHPLWCNRDKIMYRKGVAELKILIKMKRAK